jgi:hypothetical protein
MTDDEGIADYLRPFLAVQSIEALRPDFSRWVRRLRTKGIHQMPTRPGDPGSNLIDLFVLQAARTGDKDILRLWAAGNSEAGAKSWLAVLTELRFAASIDPAGVEGARLAG